MTELLGNSFIVFILLGIGFWAGTIFMRLKIKELTEYYYRIYVRKLKEEYNKKHANPFVNKTDDKTQHPPAQST